MTKKPKRQFIAEEKVATLRRHLVDKIPVSGLCEEYRIQPSLSHIWQRQMWETLPVLAALQTPRRRDGRSARELAMAETVETLKKAAVTERDAKLAKKGTMKRLKGTPPVHEGDRRGDDPAASPGEVPWSQAPGHLGQRSSVRGPGLQAVHPGGGDDPRADLILLPAVERQDRQASQRHRLDHSGRQVGGAGRGDLGRERSTLGSGARGASAKDILRLISLECVVTHSPVSRSR